MGLERDEFTVLALMVQRAEELRRRETEALVDAQARAIVGYLGKAIKTKR